jgi:hypothetical protein
LCTDKTDWLAVLEALAIPQKHGKAIADVLASAGVTTDELAEKVCTFT